MGNLIGDANTKGNPWEGLGKNYKAVVQSSEVAVLLFPGTCHLIMQLPLRWRQNPSYWEGPFRDHFKNQVFISRSWWWNRPTQQRKISSQRLLVCLALSKYWRKKKTGSLSVAFIRWEPDTCKLAGWNSPTQYLVCQIKGMPSTQFVING